MKCKIILFIYLFISNNNPSNWFNSNNSIFIYIFFLKTLSFISARCQAKLECQSITLLMMTMIVFNCYSTVEGRKKLAFYAKELFDFDQSSKRVCMCMCGLFYSILFFLFHSTWWFCLSSFQNELYASQFFLEQMNWAHVKKTLLICHIKVHWVIVVNANQCRHRPQQLAEIQIPHRHWIDFGIIWVL